MLSRRLLICPPVLAAVNSAPSATLLSTCGALESRLPRCMQISFQTGTQLLVTEVDQVSRALMKSSRSRGCRAWKAVKETQAGCAVDLCQEREALWYSGRSGSSLMAVCVRAAILLSAGSCKASTLSSGGLALLLLV